MSTYPVVRGVRLPQPVRRTQYQLEAILERDGMSPQVCCDSAKELILLWLEEKVGQMPELKHAIQQSQDGINISYNGIMIRTVSLTDGESKLWAMDFIHPDNAVPTRLWETQATVCLTGGRATLFTESSFSVSVQAEDPCPTVPGFIHAITEQIGLISTCPLTDQPWTIADEADIQRLYQILTDPRRQLPVVVISAPDYRRWPISGYAPEYIISGEELAKKCFARCIVVQLPYQMAFRWSEKVGRSWAVFDGGVRIYRPELDFENDDLCKHALYSKHKILGWTCQEGESPWQRCQRHLIQELRSRPTLLSSCGHRMVYSTLFQKKLEQQRRERIDDVEQLRQSYESQIQSIQEERDYQRELAEDAYQKYRQYEQSCEILRERNYNLECLVAQLQDALKAVGTDMQDVIPIPDNYDEMSEWCQTYLAGKLEFTNRARRAVGKDPETLYSDVELVYKYLLFLGGEYRDSKMGKADYDTVADKLKQLQVENRPSVNETQAGRYEEEYYYTDDRGIRRLADMHLVRGSSRDTRSTLRIYYYWDEEARKVVVVSLPRHLTTSST